MIAGFYLSLIALGNHEREKRYRGLSREDFITHQLESTCSFDWNISLWIVFLGGLQYHTEHHLFPKVPFYHLKDAHRIIEEELQIYKKTINNGTIL